MFVQANFGSRAELRIAGVPLGLRSAADCPIETTAWFERELAGAPSTPGAGSVIAIVATDAPLLPGQCAALARRVPLGLARTGTTGSHFSGAGDMRGRAGHVSYALPHEEVCAAFGR